MDKKDMQELIAVKIQISKEEWKEEVAALHKEIKRLETSIAQEEKKARDVDAFLQNFVRENEKKLMSLAHGNQSTTDVLRTSDDDSDALAILRTHIRAVVARTKVVIEERDLLFDDREKSLKLLGVSASGESKYTLSDAIRDLNKQQPDNEASLREELAEKEQLIKRLRAISAEYEAEIDGNDDKVKGIKEELAATTTENLQLKSKVKQLEQELEQVRAEAKAAAANGNGKKGRRGSKTTS
jgi:chromosome segregation ATPase